MLRVSSISILSNMCVLRAMQVIDQSGSQIALVVDSEQRLLGTLTDGDIR